MADPISWTAIIGATVMGAGFLMGGQAVQEVEQLAVKGYNFVKEEFANKRKGKLNSNPTTDLDDINDHLTAEQRKIVKDLMKDVKKN